MTRDDLVAYVQRNGGNPGERRQPRGSGGNGASAGARAPRKCPNCGEEHNELKCPHPLVDFKDRPCWKCAKKNHVAKDCKEKIAVVGEGAEKRAGSLHTGDALRRLSALNDGFSAPHRPARPMQQKATLDDFISKSNRFSSLHQRELQTAPLPSSETPVRTIRNSKQISRRFVTTSVRSKPKLQ